MQMGPRCSPRLPHIGDDVAGFDLLACGYADARAVCVQRGQPAAVVELDVIAIACLPALLSLSGMESGIGWLGFWPLFHAAALLTTKGIVQQMESPTILHGF